MKDYIIYYYLLMIFTTKRLTTRGKELWEKRMPNHIVVVVVSSERIILSFLCSAIVSSALKTLSRERTERGKTNTYLFLAQCLITLMDVTTILLYV